MEFLSVEDPRSQRIRDGGVMSSESDIEQVYHFEDEVYILMFNSDTYPVQFDTPDAPIVSTKRASLFRIAAPAAAVAVAAVEVLQKVL